MLFIATLCCFRLALVVGKLILAAFPFEIRAPELRSLRLSYNRVIKLKLFGLRGRRVDLKTKFYNNSDATG